MHVVPLSLQSSVVREGFGYYSTSWRHHLVTLASLFCVLLRLSLQKISICRSVQRTLLVSIAY